MSENHTTVARSLWPRLWPRVEGKTPWDFSLDWYRIEPIVKGVRESNEIPRDTTTVEFAEWMRYQYCLAMRKGIELGWNSAIEATACPGCRRHAPYCDCDPAMYENEHRTQGI